MGYGLVQIEAPSVEPIELGVAKIHLRVTGDHDDRYINDVLIPGARERAELETGRQLITATWRLTLPGFPCGAIALPKGRVQSVTTAQYYDSAGDLQTIDPEVYRTHLDREPAEIMPTTFWPTNVWPTATRRRRDAVMIEFVAGYGAPAAVPMQLVRAMLMDLGHAYENRQDVITGTIATEIPRNAADIFESFRVGDEFVSYEAGT